mgnify:FL=1
MNIQEQEERDYQEGCDRTERLIQERDNLELAIAAYEDMGDKEGVAAMWEALQALYEANPGL